MLESRPSDLRFLSNVLRFAELDSTQDLGRRILAALSADDVVPPPTLIVAASQSAGHGRNGRSWISPAGGLYATFLVPAPPIAEALHRPLEAAVVLAEALSAAYGIPLRLKWPNDVLDASSAKLAGILLEYVPAGEANFLLIGVGVNVAPTDVAGASSLAARVSRAVPLEEVLGVVASAFDRALAEPAFREDVLRRWLALSIHRPGDRLGVRRAEESVEGIFRGLDDVGRLLFEGPQGLERIASADVEI